MSHLGIIPVGIHASRNQLIDRGLGCFPTGSRPAWFLVVSASHVSNREHAGSRLSRWETAECGSRHPRLFSVPQAEVFRFVAAEHFQNHPRWDPSVTSITQASPRPMEVGATARLVRTGRGRRIEGSVKVTEYQPVTSSTVVSRFGPVMLRARTPFAPAAPASTRLQLVIDTHTRGVMGLLLPLLRGRFRKTMVKSLRWIKEEAEAAASPT
jgi:hypothetical protein